MRKVVDDSSSYKSECKKNLKLQKKKKKTFSLFVLFFKKENSILLLKCVYMKFWIIYFIFSSQFLYIIIVNVNMTYFPFQKLFETKVFFIFSLFFSFFFCCKICVKFNLSFVYLTLVNVQNVWMSVSLYIFSNSLNCHEGI